MNRSRLSLLPLFALIGLSLSVLLFSFKPVNSSETTDRPRSGLKLLIGNLETYILSDGVISLSSIQPIFAPFIAEQQLISKLEKLHLPKDRLEVSSNIMLIKKNNKLILIDSGSGYHMGKNGGQLSTSLQTIGIEPQDITDIVITHAHIDHIGGILDEKDGFIFPSARYHIAQKEYDFWMSDNPIFPNSKDNISNINSGILFAQRTLAKISDRLQFFEYGQHLFGCLIPELAEGHSPGQTVFTIYDKEKSLKHIVDVIHTPFLVSNPEWGTLWDGDFEKAVKTRKKIIAEGVEKGTLFMTSHLPWPGLGFIDKKGTEHQWTIFPYSDPINIVIN